MSTLARQGAFLTVGAKTEAANPVQAVRSGFRNYVNFSGRSARSEYWYWNLFVAIVLVGFGVADETIHPGTQMGVVSIVYLIVMLGLILPGLAMAVRRLHDIDRSGWWLLLPYTVVGTFVLIYWACQRGTLGPNRFGEAA